MLGPTLPFSGIADGHCHAVPLQPTKKAEGDAETPAVETSITSARQIRHLLRDAALGIKNGQWDG